MKAPWKVVLALLLGLPALVGAQPCNSTKGQLAYCNALTDAVMFGFPRYTTALLPTCGTTNKGAVAYDTTTDTVKYCTGSAWTSVGAGGGVSGLSTGKIPKAASATSLADSLFSDDGTNITLASGKLIIQDHLWFGPSSASNSELYCPLGGTTCTFVTTNGSAFVPITVEGLRFRTDLKLERDAANTLALRNGTGATPQTFNWYYSYTDASNYHRGALKTSASGIEIAAETAGSGADNLNLTLTPAGDGVVYVDGNGASSIGGGPVLSGVGNIFYLGQNGQPWFGINTSGNLDSTFGKGFTFAGVAGITYLGAAKLAIGTTTTGDFTGALALNAIGLGTTDTATGSVAFVEQTAPAAPAANGARLYAKDNGAGKTQLCVLFSSGAEQCFATQP